MEFQTFDEALDNQVLCGTCGRPKKTIESVHQIGVKTYYQLVRCRKPGCRTHCSATNRCQHKNDVLVFTPTEGA